MTEKPIKDAKTAFPGGHMRPRHHFAVSAYWLAVNLLWGALLMIIIPSQMIHLAPKNPAAMTGLVLGIGALPALVIPLVIGPLSDRCMSRWGRRGPYMAVGVAVNILGLFIVWYAGSSLNLALYFVAYLVVQIGSNISTGAYNGVIPDIVPQNQHGTASGWMAAMSQMGTILGVGAGGWLMAGGHAAASFALIALSLLVFVAITIAGIRERPRTAAPEPMDVLGFLKDLWIDPRKHPDFAWVWITRALVVMGLWTVQEYMQYYLVDVVGVSQAHKELVTSNILGTSLVLATVTGLLGGHISDRIGRKRVVYIANGMVALACFSFIFSHSLVYTHIIAALFGLGFGAYYSVDWALGCDVLPDKDNAAKGMAIWHIAFVLPQSIILPISGTLLGLFGRTVEHAPTGDITHYTQNGYTALFSLAAFFLLLGAVLIRNVRGAS